MPLNYTSYKRERWAEDIIAKNDAMLHDLVYTPTLEELYPPIEVEVDGHFKFTTEILPHQYKIHNGIAPVCSKEAKYLLHNGGKGSGKSLNLTVEMVRLMYLHPGIQIVVVTAYDYYIDEFLWPTWEKILPFDDARVKMNKKTRQLKLNNGSEIRWKAYEDAERIKGWEAHVIWIEEASEVGEGQKYKAKAIWNALIARHRAPGNYPRKIYVSQNPSGHNWVYELFVRHSKQKDKPIVTWLRQPGTNGTGDYGANFKEYEYISKSGDVWYTVSSGTATNTKNPDDYLASLLDQYNDADRRRNVEGDFNPINSLVYEMPYYSEDTHVIPLRNLLVYWELDQSDAFEIPRWWPVTVGIDTAGLRSPWAVEFYVQTPANEMICFDEIYERNVTSWDQIAALIAEKMDGWENVQYFIDPKTGPRHEGPNQESIIDEFTSMGIPVQIPKSYNKSGGILHVKRFLKPDRTQPCPYLPDYEDDETGMFSRGAAKLYYLDGHCPWNLREKEVWRFIDKKLREVKEEEEGLSPPLNEKPVDRDDHAQTAEMFALIGSDPLPKARTRRKREDQTPITRYKTGRFNR